MWANATVEDLEEAASGWMDAHEITLEDLANITKADVDAFLEEHRIDPAEVCNAVKEKVTALEAATGVSADSIFQKMADHDKEDDFETADDIKNFAKEELKKRGLEKLFSCFEQEA